MSDRFEQFVRDNRHGFDSEEPREQVWKKLQQQLEPASSKRRITVIKMLRMGAAAAVLVLAGLGVFSLLQDKNKTQAIVKTPAAGDTQAIVPDELLKDINPGYAQEVYHFTRLIELKQGELKQIEKENPDLYKKFVTDINKLDSSYNALRRELPVNPNREQLLEAMIENLRLQTEILNQQLNIIKQIKASKNEGHDNSSKEI